MMSKAQLKENDGYIYGYLFRSGMNGLVLDEGPKEHPINSAEVFIDGQYVLIENLTLDFVKENNLYGAKARIRATSKKFEATIG